MLPLQMVKTVKSSRISTINRRPRLTTLECSQFRGTLRNVKEPTHYSKRVGHEVPGVVVCESIAGPH